MAGRSSKPVHFLGTSRHVLSAFPVEAKAQLGHALQQMQKGDHPAHISPIPGVGPGTMEIRAHYTGPQGHDHRVFLVAKFPEGIYVLHAFEKKTQQTSQQDLNMGRQRYQSLLAFRREHGLDRKGRP